MTGPYGEIKLIVHLRTRVERNGYTPWICDIFCGDAVLIHKSTFDFRRSVAAVPFGLCLSLADLQ